ncbi:MAG: tetratricopeptide (TPR) repeat protein [Paracoccaceae bacterium]|jgi:tetratricopeptide (TPR) repeat protein
MFRLFKTGEALGNFSTILMGASIFAFSASTGVVPPPGTVQTSLGAGSLIAHLSDEKRKSAEHILALFRKQIEKDWKVWSANASHANDAMRESAMASFDQVLPHIKLRPSEVVSERLDGKRMADLMLAKAEVALPSVYASRNPRDHESALARKFLWELTNQAYNYLVTIPEYVTKIAPALWTDLLNQLDRVEATLATRFDRVEALLLEQIRDGEQTAKARESGISDTALIGLAKRIAADIDNPAQAFRELAKAVEIAIAVQQTAGDDDEAIAGAARLSAIGAHDQAVLTLNAAMASEETAHKTRMIRLLNAGLAQDMLARDHVSAAARLVKIADINADGHADFDTIGAVWLEWFMKGRDGGALIDLAVAGALAEAMQGRATDRTQSGTALNYLGIILHTRGEREAGPRHLLRAVAAFEEAISNWPKMTQPELWAKAQMNLANSLHALAIREPGNDRLTRAIEAYDAALDVRRADTRSAAWAMTQMNRATALRTLGEWEENSDILAQSLAAIESALEVRQRKVNEAQWAMTVLNRGITRRAMASLADDALLMQDALVDIVAASDCWGTPDTQFYRATATLQEGIARRCLGPLTDEPAQIADARRCFAQASADFGVDDAPVDRLTTLGQDGLAMLHDDADAGQAQLDDVMNALSDVGHFRGAALLARERDRLLNAAPPRAAKG